MHISIPSSEPQMRLGKTWSPMVSHVWLILKETFLESNRSHCFFDARHAFTFTEEPAFVKGESVSEKGRLERDSRSWLAGKLEIGFRLETDVLPLSVLCTLPSLVAAELPCSTALSPFTRVLEMIEQGLWLGGQSLCLSRCGLLF